MKPYERKQLLERVQREGATVGAEIPEALDLGNRVLELRSYVLAVRGGSDDLDPPISQVKRTLRGARKRRLDRLHDDSKTAETTWEEGEALVAEIVGIERALNALEEEEGGLEAEMQAEEVADTRRWREFLETALGKDEGPGGRNRR